MTRRARERYLATARPSRGGAGRRGGRHGTAVAVGCCDMYCKIVSQRKGYDIGVVIVVVVGREEAAVSWMDRWCWQVRFAAASARQASRDLGRTREFNYE